MNDAAVLVAKTSGNSLHSLVHIVSVNTEVMDASLIGLTDQVREEIVAQVLTSKSRT